MKNTDNGANNRMAAAFGSFTESTPSSAVFWVLATLLFTTGVGTITVATITPTDAPITVPLAAEEATDLELPAATTAAEAPLRPGTVKTKVSKTESAAGYKEVPAAVEPAEVDRATGVDPAAVDVDLEEVNKLKKERHDYRDISKRMDERSPSLWHLFGKFPNPPLPW